MVRSLPFVGHFSLCKTNFASRGEAISEVNFFGVYSIQFDAVLDTFRLLVRSSVFCRPILYHIFSLSLCVSPRFCAWRLSFAGAKHSPLSAIFSKVHSTFRGNAIFVWAGWWCVVHFVWRCEALSVVHQSFSVFWCDALLWGPSSGVGCITFSGAKSALSSASIRSHVVAKNLLDNLLCEPIFAAIREALSGVDHGRGV